MNELSIIICSRNRSDQLRNLIDTFDRKVILPGDLKLQILIVDNNSNDSTAAMIEHVRTKSRKYQLSYAHEKKNGLSHARNRGIKEAEYTRLAFLDDDAIPDESYLQALNRCFSEHPDVSCFAHKVVSVHINKPAWYDTEGKYAMLNRGHYDLGDASRFLHESDPLPIGSGMVVSKEIFDRYGGFDPQFGYNHSQAMMIPGEETEFFRKVSDRQIPIYYVHAAAVHHYPDQGHYGYESLCKTYAGIGFWYGFDDARHQAQRRIITFLGYPRAYFRRFITIFLRYLLSRFSVRKHARYYYAFQLKKNIGRFKGFQAYRAKS